MTIGVYKLTFPSGNFYIGKSIDIERRWDEHYSRLQKGRHTKNMQLEFDKYGSYEQKVMFECHEDHIDILEESFIARLRPALNGIAPKDRLTGVEDWQLDAFLSYFHMSTLQHIAELHNSSLDIKERDATIAEMEAENLEREEYIDKLLVKRSEEELDADVEGRIKTLRIDLDSKNMRIESLLEYNSNLEREIKELITYKKLPWWKKIFN